jgi:hypothetical protein
MVETGFSTWKLGQQYMQSIPQSMSKYIPPDLMKRALGTPEQMLFLLHFMIPNLYKF